MIYINRNKFLGCFRRKNNGGFYTSEEFNQDAHMERSIEFFTCVKLPYNANIIVSIFVLLVSYMKMGF